MIKNKDKNLQEEEEPSSTKEEIEEIERHQLPEYHFDPSNLPEFPEKDISSNPDEAVKQLDKINEEQNLRIH